MLNPVLELRSALGLTQEQLAARIPVIGDTVGNWEAGRKPQGPKMERLIALAREAGREDIAAALKKWPKGPRRDEALLTVLAEIRSLREEFAPVLSELTTLLKQMRRP